MKLFILFTVVSLFSAFYAIADQSDSTKILNHSVVKGVEKLLNDKHNGNCVLPSKDSDVMWACTGLVLEVEEPEVDSTGCFFSVTIKCPGESATISGSESKYYVNSPTANNIKSKDSVISIDSIDFK